MKHLVADSIVNDAWAAIVGRDIAEACDTAAIVRDDLRKAIETAFAASIGLHSGRPHWDPDNVWAEHKDFPREDWIFEVGRLGLADEALSGLLVAAA